ncbi:MAG: SDR family NAD(P)-dependent oxidoreductase [Rhodocyclaceae bacterium]|nr:SDR family NAD(P)-dependent oxidoreductase [Rhodocyclaceae bacterium]
MSLNPPITDWRGLRVWLIGASSGIGEALAVALAERGAMLALSARRGDVLQQVADRCREARVLPLDVTQPGAAAQCWAQLCADWGACDVVIVLAGTYQANAAVAMAEADLRATIEVNLSGVMASVAVVLPAMVQRGRGHVAVVSSVAGYSGLPRASVYGATKAGLINFAESLFLEARPRGVAVHLINPGFVSTRLTAANDFAMPALIDPAAAAQAIVAGFARGDFEMHFPARFSRVLKCLRLLPYGLYFPLLRRLTGGAKS